MRSAGFYMKKIPQMLNQKPDAERNPLQEISLNGIRKPRKAEVQPSASGEAASAGPLSKDEEIQHLVMFLRSDIDPHHYSPSSEVKGYLHKIISESGDVFDDGEGDFSHLSPNSSRVYLNDSYNENKLANALLPRPDIVNVYRTPGSSRHAKRQGNIQTVAKALSTLKKSVTINFRVNPSLWKTANLFKKTTSVEAIHALLVRGVRVLKLAECTVCSLNLKLFSPFLSDPSQAVKVNYIDFSKVVFSDVSVIVAVLAKCKTLQGIAFDSNALDDLVCKELSRNSSLRYLSLPMCYGYTSDGLKEICEGCTSLIEANFAWSSFTAEHVRVLCCSLPASLQRLDISGITEHALCDKDLMILTRTCPILTDLDISDSPSITSASVKWLFGMTSLKGLSVSRCYGVDAATFMFAGKLSYLNIFGCITEKGEQILRSHLKNVRVNEIYYTEIARPTRGAGSCMIWNKYVGESY
ncbi:unnamed protein product [Enterobius vermicularis]|uniref:F-box domain-containing protein n=1 Tax=Enterobius vermicularis TaxID=51028 RepID=A0A0N4UVT6_ENTVE|nr:unnamed protein product [Enterobius vermicularis]